MLTEVDTFWRQILENHVEHKHAIWIEKTKCAFSYIKEGEWQDFTTDEIKKTIKQTSNWKTPGIDKLHNFWIKKLDVLHPALTSAYNNTLVSNRHYISYL